MKEKFSKYDQAIALNPNDAEAYYNRGIDKRDAGQNEEAIVDLNKAIELKPTYKAYHNLGFIKFNMGLHQEAIADMDKAIALNPNEPELYYNRGIMMQNLGEDEVAVSDFDKAIALNPNDGELYTLRGKSTYNLGRKFAALNFDIVGEDGKRHIIGESSREHSLTCFTEAIADFDQVIAINENDEEAYDYKEAAQNELQDGILIRDIYKLDTLLATHPNNPNAYYERGLAKFKLGEDEEDTMADYDQAIALNPNYSEAYYSRGLLKDKIGQLAAAIEDYDKAIALNPNDADAYYSRGLAKFNQIVAPAEGNTKLDEYPEAMNDLDKAIAIQPQHVNAYHAKGFIYFYMGKTKANFQNAIANYEKAVEYGLEEQEGSYRDQAEEALNEN